MTGEEKQLRAIVRLLSLHLAGTMDMDSDELLAYAYDIPEEAQCETDQAPADDIAEKVSVIYSLYPGRCPNRGTSTGKSGKDRERIRRLIKKIGYDRVLEGTRNYVKECRDGGCYMKNFATFLNNFPEEEEAPALTLSGDDYFK